jgi:hypothetical protein
MTRRLNHVLTRFVVLTALVLASVRVHAQDPNANIYGKWKIRALIGGGAVSSRSQSQVKKIIGKSAVISPERFDFNGQTCAHPNYQRSKEETASHFDRDWRTDVSDIPFPNPVTIIDTGCAIFLYPIRKDHLMIADDGDFFEAVRVGKAPIKPSSTRHR